MDEINSRRTYGIKNDSDFSVIKDLFNRRARNNKNDLSAVMLQEDSSELPGLRNNFELGILSRIDSYESKDILDIACGACRIAKIMPGNISSYTGVDFSSDLLDIARKKFSNKKEFDFICVDLKSQKFYQLISKKRFDNIFIIGTFSYFNDGEIRPLINSLLNLLKDKSTIYIRESVSVIKERLTLNEVYSEKLKSSYSSVYRTTEEYVDMFKPITECGFKLSESDFFPDYLATNDETKLKYFIFKR